jgi:homoserine dehydrogenase
MSQSPMSGPEPAQRTIDLILVGLGNVHRRLLHLLHSRRSLLSQRYGLTFRVVGAADSQGAIADPDGLDPATLLEHKLSGGHAGNWPGGQLGLTALELLRLVTADALLEASPVNLRDGEPATSVVQNAIRRGMDVVLANKAPLALYYGLLHRLAAQHQRRLAFSATVCGGLPVINLGVRDLVAANVHKVQGVFNSTSNYILTQMVAGHSYREALAEAQRRGIAETDPSLDVDGWDTANKLTIVANAILGLSVTVRQVQPLIGIRGLQLKNYEDGEVKLVGQAEQQEDGSYQLSVLPMALPAGHKLAQVNGWQMGVVFESDLFETIFIGIDERGPTGTAAAMLRDVVNLYRP